MKYRAVSDFLRNVLNFDVSMSLIKKRPLLRQILVFPR